jgi:hypothetical protein
VDLIGDALGEDPDPILHVAGVLDRLQVGGGGELSLERLEVVLGLALLEGRLSAVEVYDLSLLDETYQIERWGVDPEAARRQVDLRTEIEAAERFLALLSA